MWNLNLTLKEQEMVRIFRNMKRVERKKYNNGVVFMVLTFYPLFTLLSHYLNTYQQLTCGKWSGHSSLFGETRGMRPLQRRKRKFEDNIEN
jgi:hypothetical protein